MSGFLCVAFLPSPGIKGTPPPAPTQLSLLKPFFLWHLLVYLFPVLLLLLAHPPLLGFCLFVLRYMYLLFNYIAVAQIHTPVSFICHVIKASKSIFPVMNIGVLTALFLSLTIRVIVLIGHRSNRDLKSRCFIRIEVYFPLALQK